MKLFETSLCLSLIGLNYQLILDWGPEAFSESENCKNKSSLMEQFQSNSEKCEQLMIGTEKEQLEECKKKLASNLISSCPHTKVKVKFIVAKRLTYCSYSC